jgi:hypothetical protein
VPFPPYLCVHTQPLPKGAGIRRKPAVNPSISVLKETGAAICGDAAPVPRPLCRSTAYERVSVVSLWCRCYWTAGFMVPSFFLAYRDFVVPNARYCQPELAVVRKEGLADAGKDCAMLLQIAPLLPI